MKFLYSTIMQSLEYSRGACIPGVCALDTVCNQGSSFRCSKMYRKFPEREHPQSLLLKWWLLTCFTSITASFPNLPFGCQKLQCMNMVDQSFFSKGKYQRRRIFSLLPSPYIYSTTILAFNICAMKGCSLTQPLHVSWYFRTINLRVLFSFFFPASLNCFALRKRATWIVPEREREWSPEVHRYIHVQNIP